MTSFIREFYESEISEANKNYAFSDTANSALKSRDKTYRKIEAILREENAFLLEEFTDASDIVRDEEIFHAYRCGMKDLLRLFISVFDEQ